MISWKKSEKNFICIFFHILFMQIIYHIIIFQSVRVWPELVNQRMGSDRGRPGLAFLPSPRQQHVQDVQVSEEQSWDVSWSSQPRQLEQPSKAPSQAVNMLGRPSSPPWHPRRDDRRGGQLGSCRGNGCLRSSLSGQFQGLLIIV